MVFFWGGSPVALCIMSGSEKYKIRNIRNVTKSGCCFGIDFLSFSFHGFERGECNRRYLSDCEPILPYEWSKRGTI